MTNPHRSEVVQEVAGTSYTFKLDLAAIAGIEEATGLDFTEIGEIFLAERMPIRIANAIYVHGLIGGGMDPFAAAKEVNSFLDKVPLNDLLRPAVLIYNAVWKAADAVAGKEEGEPEPDA